jgi:hypothetical protein
LELIALARQTAKEHGRDPDALEITTSLPDDLADIPALAANGISRLAVPVSSGAGLQSVVSTPEDVLAFKGTIDRYAEV